jgi:protein required for attachment to host cells
MSGKTPVNIHTSRAVIGVTWVVVADAAHAQIYARPTRRAPLELVQTFAEEQARAAEHDLLSDSPGRTFDSRGAGRHAKQPEHTMKQNLREAFARHIAEFVEAGRTANRFAHLAIVAAPALLGELRAHLREPTLRLLDVEIHKHMTTAKPAEIAAALLEAQ